MLQHTKGVVAIVMSKCDHDTVASEWRALARAYTDECARFDRLADRFIVLMAVETWQSRPRHPIEEFDEERPAKRDAFYVRACIHRRCCCAARGVKCIYIDKLLERRIVDVLHQMIAGGIVVVERMQAAAAAIRAEDGLSPMDAPRSPSIVDVERVTRALQAAAHRIVSRHLMMATWKRQLGVVPLSALEAASIMGGGDLDQVCPEMETLRRRARDELVFLKNKHTCRHCRRQRPRKSKRNVMCGRCECFYYCSAQCRTDNAHVPIFGHSVRECAFFKQWRASTSPTQRLRPL